MMWIFTGRYILSAAEYAALGGVGILFMVVGPFGFWGMSSGTGRWVGGLEGRDPGFGWLGGQQTIGTDPMNEHNCGLILLWIAWPTTLQSSIHRQTESEKPSSPSWQISPIYINNNYIINYKLN